MIGGAFDNKCIKCKTIVNETLSIDQYLVKIRPYLDDITDDLRTSSTCKIQLGMKSCVFKRQR